MSSRLVIHPRDHFHLDEMFRECWDVMEKEKTSALEKQASDVEDGNSEDVDHDRSIPWKWDRIGRIKEFFGSRPSDYVKSLDVDTDKFSYEILLDVKYFTSEELEITLTDRTVVIKGTQEEKENEHGAVCRQFTRKYILPSDAEMERILCHLSADGILHIKVPRTFEDDEVISAKEELHTGQEAEERKKYSPKTIIHTLEDFDMTPFWARELTNHSQFGNKSDTDNFKVVVDIGQFIPGEVDVCCAHNYVKVEAKHAEKEDTHGLITRHLIRKYWLPPGVTAEEVKCYISEDGVLEILAPNPKNPELQKIEGTKNPVQIPIVLRDTKV